MMLGVLARIEQVDIQTLYLINHSLSCHPLDVFFSFVTEIRNYALPGAAMAVYLWIRKGLRGRLCLLSLLLCVGMSDGISSRLIKPWVHRLRPCVALPHVLMPHGDRGTFSFPSSHAVNIAGAMVILALCFPAWAPAVGLLAALVGLSRVYLGLHYPSDILAGYLIGGLIGWGSWRAVVQAAADRRLALDPEPAQAES